MSLTLAKNPANLFAEELKAALLAARAGREVLLHYSGKLSKIQEKFQAGLVSEADQDSEREIKRVLNTFFPSDNFLGEEMAFAHEIPEPKAGSRSWVVDPLDGTTNYVHQFPIYAVSIGLTVGTLPVVGVIDMPALKETYTATQGGGAFVNGVSLSVSDTKDVKKSFLATGFFGDHEEILQEQIRVFSSLVRKCRAVRRAGAAAYDLAQVARGVFDCYWERNLKPWDSAAGVILVREAGGIVQTYRGLDYNPWHSSIIAGSKEMVKIIQQDMQANLDSTTL